MTRKLITLQRVNTPDGQQRALAEIERVINSLKVDGSGNIVATPSANGPVGSLTGPTGPVGPQGPPGPAGAAGSGGGGGGGAAALARVTVPLGIASTPPDTWVSGDFALGKSCLLLKVSSDVSVGIRLYFNSANRDADITAGRLPGVDPGLGFILAEAWLDLSNGRAQDFSPVPVVYNSADPAITTIYYAVKQTMTGDSPINFELITIPLES